LLKDAGVLSHLYRDCLAKFCQALARITEGEAELAKAGLTYTTPSGYIRPSPWLKIVESAVNTVTQLSVELRMTPSSRARVKVEVEQWDEFDDFLARRHR
jgi:P27 family predicted phage terminase small subunit